LPQLVARTEGYTERIEIGFLTGERRDGFVVQAKAGAEEEEEEEEELRTGV
jgi:hypothetical protein